MKDSELEALIRKTSGKSGTGQRRKERFVDPTLEATRKEDERGNETEKLFKEMKKREF